MIFGNGYFLDINICPFMQGDQTQVATMANFFNIEDKS